MECVQATAPRIPRVLRGGGSRAGDEQQGSAGGTGDAGGGMSHTQKRLRGDACTRRGLFRAPSSDSMLNFESTARVASSESFACARWIFAAGLLP